MRPAGDAEATPQPRAGRDARPYGEILCVVQGFYKLEARDDENWDRIARADARNPNKLDGSQLRDGHGVPSHGQPEIPCVVQGFTN